ncbi:MAG TPA: Ig-like domain-containing protein [Chitinispirillaceae bacterium]|nr:Ig-like domain-containing protein [Chitinispirillaceae bacterium]
MKLHFVVLMLFWSTKQLNAGTLNRVSTSYGQKIFISGINVAWKQFGGDVGKYPVDSVWFAKMLQGVADSGGNAVRWWLFTDCSNDPQIDPTTKLVKGLGVSTISNIKNVLDMGYARGVGIDLCLLSFDMMKTGKTMVDMEANKKILQTDEGRKAFIDNAVVPLVKAIGHHPAILNWEIFNEPEGMVQSIAGDWGSMATGIEITHIQKMVNQATGAIHRAVPGVPVSNGCWSFIAGANTIPGDNNYYSDSVLVKVGGDPDGTLDYYMVHYYEWAKTERSPFHHPASYWGLDKPLVIGEFPAKGLSAELGGMTPAQCWKYLMDNGYAGAMGWTYTAHDGFGGLPEAGQGMQALKTATPSAVTLDFPPAASDDWYADTAGKTLTVVSTGVLENDREPTVGQLLSASVLSLPSHGTLELNAGGSFTYSPSAGWCGTDRFTYVAKGGNASDTATVMIRVLDPSKCAFFAPPKAKDWKIYSEWGSSSVTDVSGGLGMNHPQWGSMWTWIVGTGITVQVTAVEQTLSVLVKNDPASPWGQLRFHLTNQNAPGNYGPTDTTADIIKLTAQSSGSDGFVEYRGVFEPKTAGTYFPAIQFMWNDTDGNGPNSNHQSVVRNLEIWPTKDFVSNRKPQITISKETAAGIRWNRIENILTLSAPGEMLRLRVTNLQGRLIVDITDKGIIQWERSLCRSVVVVFVTAGMKQSQFLLPVR